MPGWALVERAGLRRRARRQQGAHAARVRRAGAAARRARRALHRLGPDGDGDRRARPARRGRGLRGADGARRARGRAPARVRARAARAGLAAARARRRRPAPSSTRRAPSAAAYDAGLELERRRSQILLGRALAAAGERQRAIRELRDAELALDAGGALTLRDEARRELRKLGHRVDQARRRGAPATAPRAWPR